MLKKFGGNMKRLTTLLLAAGLLVSTKLFAQTAAQVIWDLGTDVSAAATGDVMADTLTLHGTLTIHDFTGGAMSGPAVKINNGTLGWGDETWYVDNRFVDLTVSPKPGFSLHVDSVAFWMGCSGTHGHFHAAVYWDTDTNFFQKHLLDLDSSSAGVPDVRDRDQHDTSYAINTTINDGGHFVLGFFPWYDSSPSTSKYLVLWLVRVYGTTSSVTGVEDRKEVPTQFALKQNYPNPFNPSTTINFDMPQSDFVTLNVFNLLGEKVGTLVNQNMRAGSHSVNFDAANLPSGIYFYQLKTGEFNSIKKMTLLK
jgi:Secretion system C-terminal sorting domain